MIVRKIQPTELDATVILFNYYLDELIEEDPSILDQYHEDSMIDTIRQHAINYQHCWFNAFEGQRPVGFIAGFISEVPWNKSLVTANINYIYMLKSHNTPSNIKSLLEAFNQWAKLCSAKEITLFDKSGNVAQKRELYKQFGFKEILLMDKEISDGMESV